MSDESKKKGAEAAAVPAPRKGGAGPSILMLLLPALLAGGAAFGGAKIAGAHRAPPAASAAAAEHVEAVKPPGPTLSLEPFLLTVQDANKKVHPMKVTMAVEFEAAAKEEGMKSLTPRLRDSILGFLRTTSYEETIDPSTTEKIRGEILERVRAGGAREAQRVLITDLVVQ